MDQRTRKLMAMHKTLHHRDYADRLYVSRNWEEEDSLAFKTAMMHRYHVWKTTWPPEMLQTTRRPTVRQ